MVEPAYAPRLSASVGAAIRRARTGRYSLAELARRSGTSVGALSLIERGRGNPSFETLVRIADALGMSIASLVATPEERAAQSTGSQRRSRSHPGQELAGRAVVGQQTPILLPSTGQGSRLARSIAAGEDETGLAEMAAGSDVTVLPRSGPGVWRDSMLLHGGQEAVVAVHGGAVEITMFDRSDELGVDVGEPLSVDINVRGVPPPTELTLPPVSDPS